MQLWVSENEISQCYLLFYITSHVFSGATFITMLLYQNKVNLITRCTVLNGISYLKTCKEQKIKVYKLKNALKKC